MDIIEKSLTLWDKLPKVLRWVLLFPVELVILVIIGLILRITVLAGGLPMAIFNLIFPPLMSIIGLFIIYHLAPSRKSTLVMILIAIRSLFIPIFILSFVMHLFGADISISVKDWWTPFIAEILILIASIWLYRSLKSKEVCFKIGNDDPFAPKTFQVR